MHGAGNDFVVFDAINQHVSLKPEQIRQIADRHTGIGCDQVLLVEQPTTVGTDFRYRIFNSDGGEVNQCGNYMYTILTCNSRIHGRHFFADGCVGTLCCRMAAAAVIRRLALDKNLRTLNAKSHVLRV